MTRRLVLRAGAAALASPLLSACGGGGGGGSDGGSPPPVGSDSLLSVLQADGNLSLFASAVSRAELGDRYGAASGNLTLFAADNAAMDELGSRLGFGDGSGLVSGLPRAQWAGILNYSTLPQALSLATLDRYAREDTRPNTLYSFEDRANARQLIFVPESGALTIWGGVGNPTIATTRSDIGASNGVLHVVSAPVVPRGLFTVSQMLLASADGSGSFGAQLDASLISELNDTAKRFTVYVPGFVQVPTLTQTGVRHHITSGRLDGDDFSTRELSPLAGQRLSMNRTSATTLRNVGGGAAVTITDVDFWASNGVIHVINAVIPL